MDKAYPLSTLMVVQFLDPKKDPLCPKEDDREIPSLKVSYLNAIFALLYLAQCTKPDIAFSVNFLARFSSAPTQQHQNDIKHIF